MMEEESVYDRRENSDHALIRNYRGSCLYERPSTRPINPRKTFQCDACENYIQVGQDTKFVIKAYGYDGDWPSTNICGTCMEDEKVQTALKRILDGEFDEN